VVQYHWASSAETPIPDQAKPLQFEVCEIERALYLPGGSKSAANRHHWKLGNDIAKIANTHIDRIQAILAEPRTTTGLESPPLKTFLKRLRMTFNNAIQ